jgi:hypothetical protein
MPEAQVATEDQLALARTALEEVTSASSIGSHLETRREDDGTLTLQFACELAGYPAWRWTVSMATLEGEQPSVLETDLLPTEGSLLSPEWVPWSVRLAEYKEAARLAAEAGIVLEDEHPEDLDDLDDVDDPEDDDDDDHDGHDEHDALDSETDDALDEVIDALDDDEELESLDDELD